MFCHYFVTVFKTVHPLRIYFWIVLQNFHQSLKSGGKGVLVSQLRTSVNYLLRVDYPLNIGAGINGIAGESNTCRIDSIFGQTAVNGSAVFITSGHKLGTATSSKRFKENINPMNRASEVIFSLKPVAFRYKKEIDPERIPQFGLVAEDVEKVNPT